jgi:hypothetical protein
MPMTGRNPTMCLEVIALFTAAGFSHRLAPLVRRAYAAGCTLPQVLAAIEAGRMLGDLPPATLRLAWTTAHDWAWMAARRARGLEHALPAVGVSTAYETASGSGELKRVCEAPAGAS